LISGLRPDGPCAPWLFEGPINGEEFLAWVQQGLAPTLRHGDVVILDNLATHKIRGVREAIEAAGARLRYLPPHPPDFNRVEPMWSRTKQILRSQAPPQQRTTTRDCPHRLSGYLRRLLPRLFWSAQCAAQYKQMF
jgi:transposase